MINDEVNVDRSDDDLKTHLSLIASMHFEFSDDLNNCTRWNIRKTDSCHSTFATVQCLDDAWPAVPVLENVDYAR
jgi:hypothetical protein